MSLFLNGRDSGKDAEYSGLNSDSENTIRQKGGVADGLFSLICINKCGLQTILKKTQENTCWVYLSVIGFR